jgi:hypothetical protein
MFIKLIKCFDLTEDETYLIACKEVRYKKYWNTVIDEIVKAFKATVYIPFLSKTAEPSDFFFITLKLNNGDYETMIVQRPFMMYVMNDDGKTIDTENMNF